MISYPFHKLLIYIFAIAQNDRTKFAELVELYLPSIDFKDDDPYRYVYDFLEDKPIPKPILNGNYTPEILNIFLKQQRLLVLHNVINKEDFQNLVFDTDLRRKIDGMALSSVFRKVDILTEFSHLNTICVEAYLECFCDFSYISNKRRFVTNYIADKIEQTLCIRILENTSRQYLKIALGIKLSDSSPLEIINHSLNIAQMKMQAALLAEDDTALDKWIKMSVFISDKLHKIGAGSKWDVDDLIEALKVEPDYCDPIIYTKEQLEEKFQNGKTP